MRGYFRRCDVPQEGQIDISLRSRDDTDSILFSETKLDLRVHQRLHHRRLYGHRGFHALASS